MASDQDLMDAFGEGLSDPAEKLLFADAVLGHELQLWAKSQVGRYVIGRAKIEVIEFLEWSLSDDATPDKFEQRRAKALAARTLLQWTLEQVQAGSAAEHSLEQIAGEA